MKPSGTVTNDLLSQDVIYSIAGSKDELWVGRQQGGLTNLRFTGASFAARTYTERDGLAQNSVYTVHQNPDGTVWAGTVSGGVSKLKDGKFAPPTQLRDGLAANTVTSIEDGPNGAMWFGTSGGLTELAKGKWRTYTTRDGLPADNVSSILRDSAGNTMDRYYRRPGVPACGPPHGRRAGNRHFARTDSRPRGRSKRITMDSDREPRAYESTETRCCKAIHAIRISASTVLLDGLRGTEGVKRDRSVAKDLDGDIWFSLNVGLSVVHPDRANHELLPAAARVENVLVDGNPIA